RNRFYFSDSHHDAQMIWVAPLFDNGAVGERSLFADMKSIAGRPDGAALDDAGRYWVAGVDGAALQVFSPDWEHLLEVPRPVTYPTKLAFYGEHCENLVITSKRDSEHGGRLTFLSFELGLVVGTRQPGWKRP